MARMPRMSLASAVVLAIAAVVFPAASAQTPTAEPLLVPKDYEVAKKAQDKSALYCADAPVLSSTDKEAARQTLLDASGDNVVLEIMKSSKSQDDVGTQASEKITVTFLIGKAGPLVASILLLVVFFFCCWTACPCCRCLRCCKKRKHIPRVFRATSILLVGLIIFGLVISASLSFAALNKAVEGFEATSCTAATLVNSTLSGQKNPDFLGLINVLEIFDRMISETQAGSSFLTKLETILLNTKKISDAVSLTDGTLTMLRDMMADAANTRPKTAMSADLYHKCTLCPSLESALTPAIGALNDSVGKALEGARAEVKKQLSGDNLVSLSESLTTATGPLSQLKVLIRDSFGPFVSTNQFKELTDQAKGQGSYGSVALILVALLIALCGLTGAVSWTFREKTGKGGFDAHDQMERAAGKFGAGDVPGNPYRAGVHRCMCCTWCWGFCYCIFAFLIGGIMVAISVPLSSICLILDDVDSQMLYDIGPAVGLNLTGPDGKMITTMIDQCFRNPDPKANPVLLNLIDVDDNGTTKTMYEMIVNKTKDSIDSQFDQISSSMSAGGSTSLVSEPSMVALMSTLGNSEMDGLMLPDKDKDWQNDVLYGDMGLDSRGSSGLATYWFNSSSKCSDYTVPADMGAASGKTIPGIDDYKNTLSFYGTPIASTSCGKKVVCSALPGSTDGRACAAGNNFMQLKQDLQTINTFRCKMFYKNGALCYPDTMAETPAGSGNWAGDCFKADGTLEVKTEDCDLATFTALIQRFNPTLNKVLTRLDGATVSAMADINVNMRALVNLYIIDEITKVANGVTCGFLGQTYQGVIDGMCYGGVAGFVTISNNYVACAVLTLFLILLSYTFWRISLDNYNSGQKSLVADANAGAPGSEGANGVHAYVVK
eukprot:CAMPEP_0115166962 /NCGR_PEP_ID=MMETSP0227-20121206/74397_1 /TAXON_ID=89957 /ORGANISM="Polarella glacialis, Strain CCMP 1383" /LENGTH=887 /DNA_ID=CAMNT_0002579519 /DNA_START=83 /DNA_END=2746 /DNA_ORIENTATION=+